MAAMSTSIRARRERRLYLVAFAAAVVGALLGINTLILHLSSDPLVDIHAYYDAATRLNHGLPLYAQAASTNDAEFYRVAAKTPRSNCVMDCSKILAAGVKIRGVEEALEDSLKNWKPE